MNKFFIFLSLYIVVFILYGFVLKPPRLIYNQENLVNGSYSSVTTKIIPKILYNKYCICLIAYKPNIIWLEFLNKFKNYDIYIMIDDNTIDYAKQYNKIYPNLNIIQIDNDECENNGFVNSSTIEMDKKVIAWDKGLYYFSNKIYDKYDYVWFMEDDVFLYNEETLLNIDSKYRDYDDLLLPGIHNQDDPWKWHRIEILFPPPYYRNVICAVRMSKLLLNEINKYAQENKTLFFIEAMFPTICKYKNLKLNVIDELSTIVWRHNYTIEHINKLKLYHPIKDIESHKYFRETIF